MFLPRIASGPLRRALVLESPDPVLDEQLSSSGWEVVRVEATPNRAGLVNLLDEFSAAVSGSQAAVPGPAEAILALRVAEAAERSIEAAAPLRLNETGDGYELC